MSEKTAVDDRQIHEVTQEIINRLLNFEDEDRRRVFRTALTFYGLDTLISATSPTRQHLSSHTPVNVRAPNFTEHAELPPKDFLFQKQPRTDIERIACLAYYLTHYRNTRHFKTVDMSKLNTEAAQIKFSNAAFTVVNATNAGLLASAEKGNKQISALGERYVEALPGWARKAP
jgi:hypothetical protein